MSLLTDLASNLAERFLSPIINAVKSWLGPFGKLVDKISEFFTKAKTVIPDLISLGELIGSEINEWKNFKEAVPYRTGVINLPRAVQKTQELIDQIKAAWAAIVDLAREARAAFRGGQDIEPEDVAADLETDTAEGLVKLFPKLAKVGEKLLAGLAVVLDLLDKVETFQTDFREIVESAKAIREEVETGSTIFLSQKNPRRIVGLREGGSMKIRVGNLHS